MPYRIEHLLSEGVGAKVYPGAVWGVGDSGGARATGTTGVLAPYEPDVKMRLDTVFDAASLTKILAVWASIGALWEDSGLDLDAPLGSFWDEAASHPPRIRDHPPTPDPHHRPPSPGPSEEPLRHRPCRHQPRGPARSPQPAARRSRRVHRPGHPRPRPPRRTPLQSAPRPVLRDENLALAGHGRHPLQPAARRHRVRMHPHRTRPGHRHPPQGRCLRLLRPPPLRSMRHRQRTHRSRQPGRLPAVHARPHHGPGEAGFGAEWSAHSLATQTDGLQPECGLFWHPAFDTTDKQDVWAHYGFTGTGMWIFPAQDRWAVLPTNKLYYTRDRQPLTDVRNAFRQEAFGCPLPAAQSRTPMSLTADGSKNEDSWPCWTHVAQKKRHGLLLSIWTLRPCSHIPRPRLFSRSSGKGEGAWQAKRQAGRRNRSAARMYTPLLPKAVTPWASGTSTRTASTSHSGIAA